MKRPNLTWISRVPGTFALAVIVGTLAALVPEAGLAEKALDLDTGDTAQNLKEELQQLWEDWGGPVQMILLFATAALYFLWRDKSAVWKFTGAAALILVFGDELVEFIWTLDGSDGGGESA